MSTNQVTQEQIAATITTWTHLAKQTDWSAPKVGLALLAERDRLEAKVQRLTELRDALVESLESMGGIPMTDRLAAALDESRTVIEWRELADPPKADGWMPIATAPKDRMILTYERGSVSSMRWDEQHQDWIHEFPCHSNLTHWRPMLEAPDGLVSDACTDRKSLCDTRDPYTESGENSTKPSSGGEEADHA